MSLSFSRSLSASLLASQILFALFLSSCASRNRVRHPFVVTKFVIINFFSTFRVLISWSRDLGFPSNQWLTRLLLQASCGLSGSTATGAISVVTTSTIILTVMLFILWLVLPLFTILHKRSRSSLKVTVTISYGEF